MTLSTSPDLTPEELEVSRALAGRATDDRGRAGAPAAIVFAAVLLGLTLCPVVLVLWGMVR